MVSRDSVGIDSKGSFVFQVDDEHAKKVTVNVLRSAGDISVVQGDIDPKLKLVVTGGYQIADGDAVRSEEVPVAEIMKNEQELAALRRGSRAE